ncbi:MAG: hypothetical protein AAFP77_21835 [Bacteroidota bacterium]
MKNLSLTLLLACCTLALTAQTQVPNSILEMVAEYTTHLQNREFSKAADYLHPNMDYALPKEAWITAQESTVNEDMSMRTVSLQIDEEKTAAKQIEDKTYYFFTMVEEVEAKLEREIQGQKSEVSSEMMLDFSTQYGEQKVRQIDAQRFMIERQHQLMLLPTEGEEVEWQIVDFPDGRLDLAYGILPVDVWRAFFPGRILTDRMRYSQAVPQAVGRFFQLLKAKNYDAAAALTIKQENAPARFMKWYKSLDNETTLLEYSDYQLTTPVRIKFHDGQRYAGFGLQFTLNVGFAGEEISAEDIDNTKELLEEVYPNTEVRYDEEAQRFTLDVFSATLAVADATKNNWKLLLEDRANGMSISDNIAEEIQQGAGLN